MLKIVHLSDIHIPKDYVKDQDFRTVKQNLIKDIEKQKKALGPMDIVVFSGDFVNKGLTELFSESAKDFITTILTAAEVPRTNVVFVPGNHDAKRPEGMVLEHILKVRNNCEVTNNKDDVAFLCKRFDIFSEFIRTFDDSCKKSYGVKDIVLDSGKIFRFIRLNSALATYDGSDYNNLFITKVQLDEIMSEIDENVKPELTFLVMHHPLDWFTYDERQLLDEYISDDTKFNVDIIMNGHIHNGHVSLKSDLDNNIITLVSGIGYGKINRKASVYPENYRYAIYCIDDINNKLEGHLRITNSKKTFGPDLSLYKKINVNGVFSIPLKIEYDILMYKMKIPLNTSMVLSKDSIKYLDDVLTNLRRFEQQIKQVLDGLPKKKSSKEKINFFLFNLCLVFRTIFFPFIDAQNIRVHVRHFFSTTNENGCHKVIMSLYGDNKLSGPVSVINWEIEQNLIYHSFKEHRTLLASMNPDKIYKNPESRWDEFLSLAISYSEYSNCDVPAMSMGVSFDWDNMEQEIIDRTKNTLYALSYVGLENVVDYIFEYANTKLKFKNFNFKELGEEYENRAERT